MTSNKNIILEVIIKNIVNNKEVKVMTKLPLSTYYMRLNQGFTLIAVIFQWYRKNLLKRL